MKTLATLAVILAASAARADSCPIAVSPVVVPVAGQAVQVQFPLFTVSNGGDQADAIRALLAEVRALRAEVAQLRAALKADGVEPVDQVKDHVGVIKAHCASCHRADVAKAKGGKLVLIEIDGTLPPFSLEERAAIVAAVQSGSMPKRPALPLPADHRQLLLGGLFDNRKEGSK